MFTLTIYQERGVWFIGGMFLLKARLSGKGLFISVPYSMGASANR
jgi:hypothetical protein